MYSKTLTRLFVAAMLTVPTVSQAVIINITSSDAVFSGLGVCGTGPVAGACTGAPAPGIGSVDNGAPTWGIGLPYDMVRIQGLSIIADTAVPGPIAPVQRYDFAVGDTGGGSAGPCCGSVDYALSFSRSITVNGVTQQFTQAGNLRIGWSDDTITIFAGSQDFILPEGILTLTINGDSLTASGDPEGAMDIQFSLTPTAVPEPSTLALFGLALAGFAARRRRI